VSTTTETMRLDRPTDGLPNPQRIIHLYWVGNPYEALCGARLNGRPRPDAHLECHVCAEIDGRLP
jgi:hypothetical protein